MPDTYWYLNRLKSMTFSEITYRLYQQVYRQLDRLKRQLNEKQCPYGTYKHDESKFELITMLTRRLRYLFQWNNEKDFFLEHYPGVPLTSLGCFPVFELDFPMNEGNVDWHVDPKSGKRWPATFSGSLDIRDSKHVGEVDYVWRISRCQHLFTIAKTGFLANNDSAKNNVIEQISSWITSNPYLTGVNWTSSMELAIRCISWFIALSFLTQEGNHPDSDIGDIITSIKLQADYIENHLSQYSSANNHLVSELTGLISIGLIFKNDSEGQKWLQKGLTELTNEVDRQIYSDGVNKEQSTHYHSFVLDCLLWVIVIAKRDGIEIPGVIARKAETMCCFLAAIMDASGNVPAIGDSDDGYLLWLTDMEKLNNYRSQLATGAVLFNRPEFKAKAKIFDEKSFWLLGTEGYTAFEQLCAPLKPEKSQAFPDGGYYVMKSGLTNEEKLLIFDCGPLGYPSTAAHGHADAMSIYLSIGGSPVLIDPGTYTYLSYPEWREYFRSTAAHNTVTINDSNQSQTGGPYIWIKQAKSRCDAWYSSPSIDYVAGYHDGYLKRHGVMHQRRILFVKPDYFLIEDCFDGNRTFDAQTFFHFAQGETILQKNKTHYQCKYQSQLEGPSLQIIVPDWSELQVDIVKANESTTQGWISPRYGHKIPASVMTTSVKTKGEYRLPHLLIPKTNKLLDDSGTNNLVCWQFNIDRKPGYEQVVLEFEQYHDDIFMLYDPDLILKIGTIEIGAQTVLVRCRIDGTISSVFSMNTSNFKLGGGKKHNHKLKNAYIDLKFDEGLSPVLNGEVVDTISPSSKIYHRDDIGLFRRADKSCY